MKQMLAMILALCMCVSILSVAASAEGTVITGEWSEGITWSFEEATGTLTISGTGDMEHYCYDDTYNAINEDLIQTVVIGADITAVGKGLLNLSNLTQFVVDANNANFCAVDGVLYSKDLTNLVRIPSAYTGEYTILDGVTELCEDELDNCLNLTVLTIPASVSDIYLDYTYMPSLEKFIVDPESQYYYTDESGVLYNKAVTRLERMPWQFQGAYVLPDTVTSLWPAYAINGCHGLTELHIGAAVGDLDDTGDWSYFNCASLTGIWVDENNPYFCSDENGVLYNKDMTELLRIPRGYSGRYSIPEGVTLINFCAADGCSDLISIGIPEGVTGINQYAFTDCSSLTSVILPASLEYLGWWVFAGCDSLKDVYFLGDAPVNDQNQLGYSSFNNLTLTCYYPSGNATWTEAVLTNKYHGGNVTWVARDAATSGVWSENVLWSYDQNTRTLTISGTGNMEQIPTPPCAEFLDQITTLAIGANITYISSYLLSDLPALTAIQVDENNAEYKSVDGLLYSKDQTYLERVPQGHQGALVIAEGTESTYEWEAFSGCTGVTSLTIPSTMNLFGWDVNLPALEKFIVHPDNPYVTTDENGVLYSKDMTKLMRVPRSYQGVLVIPETVTSAYPGYTLWGCDGLTEIYFPAGVTNLDDVGDWNYFGCKKLTGIWVDENNPYFCSDENGVLYNKDMTTLLRIPQGYTGGYTIPESVTLIECCAADACTGLTAIHIPDGVTGIGQYGFYQCSSLTSVTLPANLKYISQWGFASCENLTEVYFRSDAPVNDYNQLGYGSFSNLTLTCYYPADNATWTEAVLNDDYHGGTVTWVGINPEVVTPSISLEYPTVQLEDEILMTVYYTLDEVGIELQDMGMLTWDSMPANGTIYNAQQVIPGSAMDNETGCYSVTTKGIAAKNLGDTIYFCVYIKLADGSYTYSKVVCYSPMTYAYNLLSSNADTASKALIVSMLNYAAAAQTYFGYNTDNMVNAALTDAQNALVSTYDPSMVQSVAPAASSKLGVFAANGGYSAKKPTVSFEGAFSINYYFTASAEVASDVRFYYWTQEAYDNADVLTAENATGTMVMTANGSTYGATVAGIAAKELDRGIYVAAVYTAEDGTTYSTGVLHYSLGIFCVSQAADGSDAIKPMAAATAVYGYYAKSYFNK